MNPYSLNIYFAGAIRGGDSIQQREDYFNICRCIALAGHTLTTEHQAANPDSEMHKLSNTEIYIQDISAITRSDMIIAEISTPSHGVGYEIAYASDYKRIPTLCLYRKGTNPSAMLLGNSNILCFEYENASYLGAVLYMIFKDIAAAQPEFGGPSGIARRARVAFGLYNFAEKARALRL